MALYIRLEAEKYASGGVVLVNGATDTGYKLLSNDFLAGFFGESNESPIFSRSGKRSPKRVTGIPDSRTFMFKLRVSAASQNALVTKIRDLAQEIDACNRYGGKIRMRAGSLTYSVNLIVEDIQVSEWWSSSAETLFYHDLSLQFTCQQYAEMDSMDIYDPFSTDTFGTGGKYNDGGADWTFDAQSGGTAVSGGKIVCSSSLTTERRLYHSGSPYTPIDCQATARFVCGSVVSGFKVGVAKRVDSDDYIEVYVDDTGAASRLRIDTIESGARTNRASTTVTRLVTDAFYAVRMRVEDNTIHAQLYVNRVPYVCPELAFDTNEATYTMTGSTATALGTRVQGRGMISINPQHASTTVDEFRFIPYAYANRGSSNGYNPLTKRMNGVVPGDVDAKYDLHTVLAIGGAQYNKLILATAASPPYGSLNLVDNPSFESGSSSIGWVVTAVSGVTGAATSITTVAPGYNSSEAGQVVTPATSDTGASRVVNGPFRAGVTYTATVRMRSSGGSTTAVRCKLGVSGDIANSLGEALTTSWQLFTATWTPTADRDFAYVVVGVGAATATTFQVDDVRVYEGTSDGTDGWGAVIPFGVLDVNAFFQPTAFTSQASTDARGGSVLGVASGSVGSALYTWIVNPSKFIASEGVDVPIEVWALVDIDSTRTDLRLPVYTIPMSSNTSLAQYAIEFGSSGRLVKQPTSGNQLKLVFLGTLMFDCSSDYRSSLMLTIDPSSASGGRFGIDYIMLLPSGSAAMTQSGTLAASTVYFAGGGASAKIVNSELAGFEVQGIGSMLTEPDIAPARTSGIVGNPLTLQSQYEPMIVIAVPNDEDGASFTAGLDPSDSAAGTETHYSLFNYHLDVTPRVALWVNN